MFQGETDILIDSDGDIVIENGDLVEVNGLDWLSQQIQMIMKTNLGEWKLWPDFGGSLEEFIGENNTQETGRIIEKELTLALNRQPIAVPGTIGCRAVPTNSNTVSVFVFVDLPTGDRTYLQALDFSYNSNGISVYPITRYTPAEYAPSKGTRREAENVYLQRIAQNRHNEVGI